MYRNKTNKYDFRVSVGLKCVNCNFVAHTHPEIDDHLRIGHHHFSGVNDELEEWFKIRNYEFTTGLKWKKKLFGNLKKRETIKEVVVFT